MYKNQNQFIMGVTAAGKFVGIGWQEKQVAHRNAEVVALLTDKLALLIEKVCVDDRVHVQLVKGFMNFGKFLAATGLVKRVGKR